MFLIMNFLMTLSAFARCVKFMRVRLLTMKISQWACENYCSCYKMQICKVLGSYRTDALSFENGHFLMRFHLSSTLKRSKTMMKTEVFKNGFKRGPFKRVHISKGFWKRIVLKTLLSSVDRWKPRLLTTATKKPYTLLLPSAFLVWMIGENHEKYKFSNENELVWTGENKLKTLVW